MAIILPVPVHIGIENVAVVGKGSQIIKYYDERERMKRSEEAKGKRLGGTSSRLRRSTPFKQPWRLMKDGDLWEMFANTVEPRGSGCTTQEMVDEGKVKTEERKGNDQADTGAERGAVTMQKATQKLADIYIYIYI